MKSRLYHLCTAISDVKKNARNFVGLSFFFHDISCVQRSNIVSHF